MLLGQVEVHPFIARRTRRRYQSGVASIAGWFVTRVGLLPFALITYSSRLPFRLDEKAILAPSGDQFGAMSTAELVVSLVWLLPLAFMA